MKTALSLVCALVIGLGFVAAADKEVTIKGKICCAKCELKLPDAKKCATVIKDGDTVYYFDADADKKNHKTICQEAKDGSVVGTVTEKDGKKTIKVAKVEFK